MTPTCTFACLARYLKLLFYYCRYNSRLSTSSDPERGDTDEDNNSPRSYSNRSSPAAGQLTAPAAYVLSASGGQIIAVQNPALSFSAAYPRVGRSHAGSPQSRLLLTGRMKEEPGSPPPPPHHPPPHSSRT